MRHEQCLLFKILLVDLRSSRYYGIGRRSVIMKMKYSPCIYKTGHAAIQHGSVAIVFGGGTGIL